MSALAPKSAESDASSSSCAPSCCVITASESTAGHCENTPIGTTTHPHINELLKEFQSVYHQLNTDNAQSDLLDRIYTQDIEFIDPLHRIEGLASLKSYCQQMYANLTRSAFAFHDVQFNDQVGFIQWTLTFSHKRLNQQRPIRVEGVSHLSFTDGKISRHQDYFDAGALLYEHVPLLGFGISKLKDKVQNFS